LSGTTRVSWYQTVHFAIFWILWCKMKITQADAPTIRMDCHPNHSNWRPISAIPTIFTPDALPGTTLPIYPGLGHAPNMLACIPGGFSNGISPQIHSHSAQPRQSIHHGAVTQRTMVNLVSHMILTQIWTPTVYCIQIINALVKLFRGVATRLFPNYFRISFWLFIQHGNVTVQERSHHASHKNWTELHCAAQFISLQFRSDEMRSDEMRWVMWMSLIMQTSPVVTSLLTY